MPNVRDIKRRITGVRSTQQITKAMKLVASSKVQKAKSKVETNEFYFENIMIAVNEAMKKNSNVNSPYIVRKKDGAKKVMYIVISSDLGLCGGYNINLFREMVGEIDKSNENIFVISGKKAKEYCKRNSLNVVYEKIGISEEPTYKDAKEIGGFVIDKYLNGEVDEIYLVYTHFKTIITQIPKVVKLLPFEVERDESQSSVSPLTIYEPNVDSVLEYIVPKYVCSAIYGAFLEAVASEESSRMTAMDNASTNANEIVDELTLMYNRIRQGSITTEISEIVGGANALDA